MKLLALRLRIDTDKKATEFRRMQVLEFGYFYGVDEAVRRLRAGETLEVSGLSVSDFTAEAPGIYYLDFFISLAQESFSPTVLLKTGLSGVVSGSTE